MTVKKLAEPEAPKPFSLTAHQLAAAADFLNGLTENATLHGVFPDSGFIVELPSGLDEVQGPRVRVAFEGETDLEYVITGLVDAGGGV